MTEDEFKIDEITDIAEAFEKMKSDIVRGRFKALDGKAVKVKNTSDIGNIIEKFQVKGWEFTDIIAYKNYWIICFTKEKSGRSRDYDCTNKRRS